MRRFFLGVSLLGALCVLPVLAASESSPGKMDRDLGGLAVPGAPTGVTEPILAPPGFEDLAVFATNSIHIKDKTEILSGNVVVNDASSGPVLDGGVELNIDKEVSIAGDARADSIDIVGSASVGGTIECNDGIGVTCTGLSLPVFTELPAFQAATVRPEADDVVVPDLATVVLDADDYADITLGNGSTIVFSGGVYNIGSLLGVDNASLEFDAPTELRILGIFAVKKTSFIGPSAGSTADASSIILYVGGTNFDPSDPKSQPRAAELGDKTVVEANIWALNGTLWVKKESNLTGAFLAKDVHLDKSVDVTLDSAFVNEPPTAFAQDVQTDGASDLIITLEGSDPEGADLSFSIEVAPAGSLGAISPITPAPVDQCSESGVTCNIDMDCPGFNEGETCENVQPPITQATVTYSPPNDPPNLLPDDCETGPAPDFEVTCPEDFFTFGVTDDASLLGTAIVSVNGGTNEVADDPGTGVDDVEANDKQLDTVVNAVTVITLSAAAPDPPVSSLTFRVETLPTGALDDSNGSAVVAGVDLPSQVVTYQAPGTTGSDSFTFSARDSATSTPPCGPPSCDTGTVNIDVDDAPELAPDQSVGTNLNEAVEITLRANHGGQAAGEPGPEALLPPSSSRVIDVTYGDNGPAMTSYQFGRLEDARIGVTSTATALGVGDGWFQFGWCDIVTSPGCNDLVDLVNESEVIESPFDFTTTEDSCLRVTDTLAKGDHFRVENLVSGNVDWTDFTSEVDQSTVGTTGDPDTAFGDLEYSHGEFDLSAGTFSIRLTTIPPDSFAFGTAGYIRADTGPCVDIVWTVTSLPVSGTAPGALTNLDGSPVMIGDTYFTEPTLVFTPDFGVSGSTSFTYEVTQGGTIGIGVLDTAVVDLLVALTDECAEVGRPVGCTPGLSE